MNSLERFHPCPDFLKCSHTVDMHTVQDHSKKPVDSKLNGILSQKEEGQVCSAGI